MTAVIAQQAPDNFQASAETTAPIVQTLQNLGWVDITALGVLLVFFVMGLFKGLIWQVSRIAILVAAYFVAGQFGHDVAEVLGRKEPVPNPLGTATNPATGGTVQVGTVDVDTTLYLAYCLLFVGVLIVLSLLAMLIRKLAHKAGLGFFDRLGGGVLGVATGACVVLAGVFGINMFFPQSELARAASESHSMRLSRQAIDMIGVDADLRAVLHNDRTPGDREPGQLPAPLPGSQQPGGTGNGMPGPGPQTPPNGGSGEGQSGRIPGQTPPERRRGN